MRDGGEQRYRKQEVVSRIVSAIMGARSVLVDIQKQPPLGIDGKRKLRMADPLFRLDR